jgi:hypothetical protein
MAKMIRLDPAPSAPLPAEGWALIATEAGRYAIGLRATMQAWNGTLQSARQLALASPESWTEFVAELTSLTGGTAEEITKILLTVGGSIEGHYARRRRRLKPMAFRKPLNWWASLPMLNFSIHRTARRSRRSALTIISKPGSSRRKASAGGWPGNSIVSTTKRRAAKPSRTPLPSLREKRSSMAQNIQSLRDSLRSMR